MLVDKSLHGNEAERRANTGQETQREPAGQHEAERKERGRQAIESRLQPHHAADLKVASEEFANEFGVLFNDMKSAVFDPISEMEPSHPSICLSFSKQRLCPGCARL